MNQSTNTPTPFHIPSAAAVIEASLNAIGRDGRRRLLGNNPTEGSTLSPAADLLRFLAQQQQQQYLRLTSQEGLTDDQVLQARREYNAVQGVYSSLLGLATKWWLDSDENLFSNQRLTQSDALDGSAMEGADSDYETESDPYTTPV